MPTLSLCTRKQGIFFALTLNLKTINVLIDNQKTTGAIMDRTSKRFLIMLVSLKNIYISC